MENNTQYDYLEIYRDTLSGMLDAGEALTLYQTPDTVVVMQDFEAISLEHGGQQLEAYDQNTPEGVQAEGEVRLAKLEAVHQRGILQMTYLVQAMDAAKQELEMQGISEQEVSERLQEAKIADKIEAIFGSAIFAVTRTHYISTSSEAHYTIMTNGAITPEGKVLGRGIKISMSEDGVEKSLTISESFERGSHLELKQSILPVYDEEIAKIAEFFLGEHGDQPSFSYVVNGLYSYGLNNDIDLSNTADLPDYLKAVYEKYQDQDDRRTIDGFVQIVMAKITAYKSKREMNSMFPDMEIPSHTELQDYKRLLEDCLP